MTEVGAGAAGSCETRARFHSPTSLTIPSGYVGDTFRADVMLPLSVPTEGACFPVVYATDGNLTFEMFRGISQLLQSSGEVQPFILVGIGYPGDCPLAGAILRARDLTFPGYPTLELPPPNIEGVLLPAAGGKLMYGAEEFQDFIEHELFPLIEERFPASPRRRTYFGHSGAGGFGLYTLFNRPQLFDDYIVSSPGLIFDGPSNGVDYDDYDFALAEVRKFASRGGRLEGKRLRMSVGDEEEYETALSPWRLTSSFHRMVALLRVVAIPGLDFSAEILPQETHSSAWPMAFIHGLKAFHALAQRGVREPALCGDADTGR